MQRHTLTLVKEWSSAHARCRANRRQERCECGYNDLHRHLNNTVLLHCFQVSRFRGEGRSLVGHLPSSLLHLTSDISSGHFRHRPVRHRLRRYRRCPMD